MIRHIQCIIIIVFFVFSFFASPIFGDNIIIETNQEEPIPIINNSVGSLNAITLIEKSNGLEIPAKEGGNTEYELADLNHDGFLDIISVGDHGSPYVNTNQHGIMVWFGDGGNYWSVNQSGNFGYGGCAIGDLNLDGLNDIAWGVHHNYTSNELGDTILDAAIGDGTGNSWTPWGEGLASNGETWGMFATDLADFDVDGDLDIVSLSFGCCNGIHVYENHMNGTWTPVWDNSGGNVLMETMETGDFNADGYPDFVCSHQDVTSYIGNGSFGFTNTDSGLPVGSINGVDIGDMNNDGADDLVAALSSGMGVRCYVFDAQNNSWISTSLGLPTSQTYSLVQFGDLNYDGNLDIAAFADPIGTIYIGDGNGTWIQDTSWTMTSPADPSAMRIDGDIDFDGREDIIIQASAGSWPSDVNVVRLFSPWDEPSQPSARIITPRGGEFLRSGSIKEIRWLSAIPSMYGQAMVDISISANGISGPWIPITSNQPNNGCFQWLVTGIESDSCRIKIKLHMGNTSISAISPSDFTIVGGSQSAMLTNLSPQWNLISLPFNLTINLSAVQIKYDNVSYNWSEATTLNIISNSVFGWERQYQTYLLVSHLTPGQGYWAYAYEPCEMWIQNISIHSDNFITAIKPNWNIISSPYNQPVNKTNLLVNESSWSNAVIAGLLDENVFGWDSTVQTYYLANTFNSGKAYWLYAYQSCVLRRVV